MHFNFNQQYIAMKNSKKQNATVAKTTRLYLLGGFSFIQEDWMKKKKFGK